jgi:ribonuclease D
LLILPLRPCAFNGYETPVFLTGSALAGFLTRLEASSWVALDTEADSLHAYPEKLCLLQLACAGEELLLDPLSSLDLRPLLAALGSRELIFHAADYDLRLLRRAVDFVPSKVFDTMEAARLAGRRQFGLRDLVRQFLGIELEKGPQRANWARRPLTPRMAAYALNDVRHLKALADVLGVELDRLGRRSWLEQNCARLVRTCAQVVAIDADAVWRLGGSQRLNRRGLAVLRELWHWREAEAREANRPPYFVVPHEWLVAAAQTASADGHNSRVVAPGTLFAKRRQRMEAALARGLAVPANELPELRRPNGRPPTSAEVKRYETLKTHRDTRAQELELDPTILASRAALEAIARRPEAAGDVLLPWQREVLR